MNVCQPNVARFVHMVCRFDKIKVLGLRFTFDARTNLSLVQINVIYDYYSSKRIVRSFFHRGGGIFECDFRTFKKCIVRGVPHLAKITNLSVTLYNNE